MSAKKVIRFIYLKICKTNEQRFSIVGEEELWGLCQTNKINITEQELTLTHHFLYNKQKASVMPSTFKSITKKGGPLRNQLKCNQFIKDEQNKQNHAGVVNPPMRWEETVRENLQGKTHAGQTGTDRMAQGHHIPP